MTGSLSEPIPGTVTAILTAVAGGSRPAVPPGTHQDLVELLTRLVVNPEFRDAYCRALSAERVRLGVHRSLIAAGDSGDIPELEIARSGFAGLTDEQLVDYAISPSAVNAIAERLYDGDLLPELGDWFIQAGKREALGDSGDIDQSSSLLAADADPHQRKVDPGSEGSNAEPVTAPHQPSRSARWRNLAIPAALAASLLLAFYLGTRWPGERDGRDIRLASVAVRGDVTRGIEDVALDVTNGTDRRAFLTVVGIIPGQPKPGYYYRHQGKYLELPPGGTIEVKNLPPSDMKGSTVLLLVTTDVPAGESVRNVTPPTVTPETAEQDAEQIRRALRELNIPADVRVVPLPQTKR